MSWREFVVDMVNALVWPAVVIGMVLIFKNRIEALLPDLESVELPGFKARFQKKLNQVATESRQLVGGASADAIAEEKEALQRVSEISPRAQILETWLEVEAAIDAASRNLDHANGEVRNELVRRDPLREAKRLEQAGKLDQGALDLVADLRGLRNTVVHERRVVPTVDDATKYSLAADALLTQLDWSPEPEAS